MGQGEGAVALSASRLSIPSDCDLGSFSQTHTITQNPGKCKTNELFRKWHSQVHLFRYANQPGCWGAGNSVQEGSTRARPWTRCLSCLEGQGKIRGADSPWALQFLQIGCIPFRALGDRSHKPPWVSHVSLRAGCALGLMVMVMVISWAPGLREQRELTEASIKAGSQGIHNIVSMTGEGQVQENLLPYHHFLFWDSSRVLSPEAVTSDLPLRKEYFQYHWLK